MGDIRLITLDPGHFHAALVHKESYPGVARRVHVYAPLGPELSAHLGQIAGFNSRPNQPTAWELEVHAGPDFMERMLAERPGDVVVLAGRNRQKIRRIRAAVEAGLHVLADKPWIIDDADLPTLAEVLDQAAAKRLIAYDIMTERHEITSILQRALVNDPEVFGTPLPGSESEPGVTMASTHYLMKQVAGVPLCRPAAFFEVTEQGEGLTDVGTPLVDLVQWILFPDQPADCRTDVPIRSAKRWPTVLSSADFERLTGEAGFPAALAPYLRDGRLEYFCNNQVTYRLRGIHVALDVLWDFEAAPGGGDTHFAVVRGDRARVEIRHQKPGNFGPELFVVPNRVDVAAAVRRRVATLQSRYPGLAVVDRGAELQLAIPDRYRVGHEAHFGAVTRQFLAYLRDPESLPAWELPNMVAKYFVTTRGVALGRRG